MKTKSFVELEVEKRLSHLESFPVDSLLKMIQILQNTASMDSSIFLAGNGGSASTAQHFSIDLGVGSSRFTSAFRTHCLSDNQSQLTAIGNDFSFTDVFSRQLRHYGRKGDIVVMFSASGNSSNLISLTQTAKDLGLTTIALLGFDGGKLANLVDHAILFETEVGEYGLVEDLHLAACHIITSCVRDISH